jgi:hypothetical protein
LIMGRWSKGVNHGKTIYISLDGSVKVVFFVNGKV